MKRTIIDFLPCGMKEILGNDVCTDCLGIPVESFSESESIILCMIKDGCPAVSRIETWLNKGVNL